MKTGFYKLTILLFIGLTTVKEASAQHFISIGPMLHVNIGGSKVKPSIGFEVAYWNAENFPYSVDLGFEWEKSKFRLYSEAQTGVLFVGASAGPFLEFKKGSPVQLGLQGSCWANYYLGFDFRFRVMKGQDYIAPGIYAKLPLGVGPNANGDGDSDDFDWD